jgi:uncharacterized protein YjiS (DUF1127 family)
MLVTFSTIRFAFAKKSVGFSRRFDAWCENVAGHFFRRAAIASLRELDARELRDIGLVRSQIEDAVRGFISVPGQGRRS